MLGFGLKDVEMIKTLILQLKNKPSSRKIENLIAGHLTNPTHKMEEEQEFVFEQEEYVEAPKKSLQFHF